MNSQCQKLQSLDWAEIRKLVLDRCGGKCEGCGEPLNHYWETQHQHYNYLFRNAEHLDLLLGVCPRCFESVR